MRLPEAATLVYHQTSRGTKAAGLTTESPKNPRVNNEPYILTNIMDYWRREVVTLTIRSQEEWKGEEAAQDLSHAKQLIDTRYRDYLVAATERATSDPGWKDDLAAAMYRDEAKLLLNTAQLTGNPSLITQAVECFEKAIQAATTGSSLQARIIMEREIAGRQGGKEINWEKFSQAYQTMTKLCPQAGNWERLAKTSWEYIGESLLAGRGKDLRTGLTNLKKATEKLGFNWVMRYPLWNIVTSLLGVTRRLTYPGG